MDQCQYLVHISHSLGGGAGYGIEAVPTVVMGGTLSVNLGSDIDSSWVTLGKFLVLSKPQLPHL